MLHQRARRCHPSLVFVVSTSASSRNIKTDELHSSRYKIANPLDSVVSTPAPTTLRLNPGFGIVVTSINPLTRDITFEALDALRRRAPRLLDRHNRLAP